LVGEDYAKVVNETNFATYAKLVDASQKGRLNQATRLQYSLGLKKRLEYSSSHDTAPVKPKK